ncbi:MAG TPA: hypothetical protein VG713_05425 [Pirellulales bacterium]|nr:hypothetical protein [Pirellulales bacterium]
MATALAEAPNADQDFEVPRANTRPADPAMAFPDSEFVTWRDVPVFAEHQTVSTKTGRTLTFSREQLQAIAARCNRRINETGDYATLIIGHTPDAEALTSGAAKQPEIVGFAGPFRIGQIGETGQRQRWAILADFHIFREDVARVRKYPRRSPEVWLEDRYEDMFLDPIALLGGEAPRLDMGLLYSAHRNGRVMEKYAAASPGPGNVFVPSDDTGNKRCYGADSEPNSEDAKPMSLTPDDIKEIVAAFDGLDWVQWVKGQMQSQQAPGADASGEGVGAAQEGTGAAAAQPGAADAAGAVAQPEKKKDGAAQDAGSAVGQAAGAALGSAVAGPVGGAVGGALGGAAGSAVGGAAEKPLEKRDYSAQGTVDGTESGPAQGSADGAGAGDAGGGGTPGGENISIKYARRFHQMEQEMATLNQQLEAERGARVDAERYSMLSERRQTLVFDLPQVRELCRYSKMNDEQFKAHLSMMDANFQRIPVGIEPPSFDATSPDRPGGRVEQEKYSRELSDRAFRIAENRAKAGKPADYLDIRERLGRGESIAE